MSNEANKYGYAELPGTPASNPAVTLDKPASSVPASTANAGRPVQPVTGVMPPALGEAKIREAWPSVGQSGLANLAAKLICSIFLAPLGWLLLAPLFVMKISPMVARRYTLTNRRLMIQTGLRPKPVEEVPLAEIDEVRLGAMNEFFRCGDLEIVSKGQVKMKLPAVPEPDSFRNAILNACAAWVEGKAKAFLPFQAASAVKS